MISRPVFAGPLIGLIMGDLPTGLFVGGTVELMYMGVLPIGGSVPPNAQIAGILSTVFAITSGGNPEVGIRSCSAHWCSCAVDDNDGMECQHHFGARRG